MEEAHRRIELSGYFLQLRDLYLVKCWTPGTNAWKSAHRGNGGKMIDRREDGGERIEETGSARLLGVPVGDFGLFASGLLAVSLGLAAFCGSCFAAILGMLWYNSVHHGRPALDYADSYRYVALPAGVATLVVSALVLGVLWVRRQLRTKVRVRAGAETARGGRWE